LRRAISRFLSNAHTCQAITVPAAASMRCYGHEIY
jgi:hypothetical protein